MNKSAAETFAQARQLEALPSALLCTLLYFDIFDHPLTRGELISYCQHTACDERTAAASLRELVADGLAEEKDGFFFLPGKTHFVEKRRERNARAESFLPKARRYGRFISRFPFVRGVCISGSLSKGTMDKDGDIDYFIITAPRRLWLCRTMLVLYKKIFLLNSRKYFCVNYFIDTDNLGIPDQNLFTATEIAFIQPKYNPEVFGKFLDANQWVRQFYPNAHPKLTLGEIHPEQRGRMKRFTETIFGGRLGEWLDEFFFKITLRRWQRKFRGVDGYRFDVDFRSRKTVSKHHPQGFQWKVKQRIQQNTIAFEAMYNVQLAPFSWELPAQA